MKCPWCGNVKMIDVSPHGIGYCNTCGKTFTVTK